MQEEHPLIELYVIHDDAQQSAYIEQRLAGVDLDAVALHTLQMAGIKQNVMLTLLITDEAGIRDMNKQYREQDKATDVLSFPLIEAPIVDAPADQLWTPQIDENEKTSSSDNTSFVTPPDMILNLGDVVISWPTILEQAKAAGHDYMVELMYLLSHGVLHLIGYDDQTEAGYQAMVHIQQAVLQTLGYATYKEQ